MLTARNIIIKEVIEFVVIEGVMFLVKRVFKINKRRKTVTAILKIISNIGVMVASRYVTAAVAII